MSKIKPEILDKIRLLASKGYSSVEIGKIVDKSPKAVQHLFVRHKIPCLPQGGPRGERNGSWRGGYHYQHGSYGRTYKYVLVPNHPFAKTGGYVLEHRLVMEKHLKRYLQPAEVVHHKDKNTLNNSLENLELFPSNNEHLRKELKGKVPKWTGSGLKKIREAVLKPKKLSEGEIHRRQVSGRYWIEKRKRDANGRLLPKIGALL